MPESAAYARRGFYGAAVMTTLASGITAGATTLDGVDLSTWSGCDDDGPFRFTISDGTTEEECEATTVTGNTISGITRGVGDTTAVSWSSGAQLEHTSSVRDLDEANQVAYKVLGAISGNGGKAFRVNAGATDIEVFDIAELIRDTIGTALVEGSNIDVTVNDGADTITLAVTGSLTSNIWIPAKSFGIALNTPTNALIASGYGTGWSFPDAAQHGIASNMVVPTGWATVDVDMWWVNMASSSGDVLWRVFLDDDADGAALGGGSTPGALAAIAAPSTSAVLKKSTVATGFAVTAGRLLNIAIDRNGAGGGDTLANDAAIVGVNVRRAS